MERTKPHQSPATRAVRRSTTRLPIPEAHADVILVDMRDICAMARMSKSKYYSLVKAGEAPAPLNYGPRCARWPLLQIRAWLTERIAAGEAAQAKRTAKTAAQGAV